MMTKGTQRTVTACAADRASISVIACMIEIESLTRTYGEIRAVDGVSLTIDRGELMAIVGASGSGKTTLLRMINRMIEPSAGRVRINGTDTAQLPPHLLRRGIGYVIQGHGLFPHRTVAENIAVVPRLLCWNGRCPVRLTIALPGINRPRARIPACWPRSPPPSD